MSVADSPLAKVVEAGKSQIDVFQPGVVHPKQMLVGDHVPSPVHVTIALDISPAKAPL